MVTSANAAIHCAILARRAAVAPDLIVVGAGRFSTARPHTSDRPLVWTLTYPPGRIVAYRARILQYHPGGGVEFIVRASGVDLIVDIVGRVAGRNTTTL